MAVPETEKTAGLVFRRAEPHLGRSRKRLPWPHQPPASAPADMRQRMVERGTFLTLGEGPNYLQQSWEPWDHSFQMNLGNGKTQEGKDISSISVILF